MWIVLDSFLLHLSWACTVCQCTLCQCTLCKVLSQESKRDGGAGVAVNMSPFIIFRNLPIFVNSLSSQVRAI